MVEVMLTLFAIVIVGYAAGKLGYLGGDFDRQLSRLVINITCPALILSSAMTGELPDRQYILPLLLISVVTYVVLAAVAFLLPRYLVRLSGSRRSSKSMESGKTATAFETATSDEGAVGFALMFGNVGFMGYPVVASIFGHEAVFYAAVLNVVNTFAVFTIGTVLITGRGEIEGQRFQKKVLYSTPMLAAYLTMLIVALRIDAIPVWASQTLTMIGQITVPAALLIIGSSMSSLPISKILRPGLTVWLTTALRLVVLPVGVYWMCRALGFSELVVGINTVVIAMPVATYGTILCLKYEKDATLMTETTFVTTLLSMLTIPMLVALLL